MRTGRSHSTRCPSRRMHPPQVVTTASGSRMQRGRLIHSIRVGLIGAPHSHPRSMSTTRFRSTRCSIRLSCQLTCMCTKRDVVGSCDASPSSTRLALSTSFGMASTLPRAIRRCTWHTYIESCHSARSHVECAYRWPRMTCNLTRSRW